MRRAVLTAVAVALVAVAVAVAVVLHQDGDVGTVSELERGDCVDARAFLEGQQPALAALSQADCEGPHDAEVLLTFELDEKQASAYRPVVPDLVCLDELQGETDVVVDDQRLLVAGLADSATPAAGDELACFGFTSDGTRLDGRVKPR